VVFLINHPSWTWRDLQETPEDVLALLYAFEFQRARVKEST